MRATALHALRSPDFTLLWAAQIVSGFGDRITVVALAFVTWQITRSALSTAIAVVISTIPYAVFGFFGGALADSVGRRRAMVACDLIRMLVIGAVPGILVLGLPLAVVYVFVFVAELCSSVFDPARLAIVPDLVPPERLGTSNALVYASDRTVEIAGTLLAGLLVAGLGERAFYVDAVTFGISALLLLRIATEEPARRALSWRSLLGDAVDGVRIIRDHAVLRANTIFSLLAQLSLPVVNGLTPVLIFREYGLGPEHYGATEAAIATGAVVTGLLLPAAVGGLRKGPVILAGFALLGSCLIAIALSPSFPISVVLFALVGVANVIFFVPNVTLSQEVTPPALRARVFGTRTALLNLSWLPIVLVSGLLADLLSVPVLLAAAGTFTLLVAIFGALSPSVRDVG